MSKRKVVKSSSIFTDKDLDKEDRFSIWQTFQKKHCVFCQISSLPAQSLATPGPSGANKRRLLLLLMCMLVLHAAGKWTFKAFSFQAIRCVAYRLSRTPLWSNPFHFNFIQVAFEGQARSLVLLVKITHDLFASSPHVKLAKRQENFLFVQWIMPVSWDCKVIHEKTQQQGKR